jgi:hypothetical protein
VKVIEHHAQDRRGMTLPTEKLEALHAFQEWLALGPNEVAIPYLPVIAAYLGQRRAPPPRLRRDWNQLVLLIRASAVIHQRHRERDEHEHIVANLDDYETARAILADMLARSEGITTTEEVRKLVNLVKERILETYPGSDTLGKIKDFFVRFTAAEIARLLEMPRSSAWRVADEAINAGYLVNLETRPRQPMRLSIDEPLPEPGEHEYLPNTKIVQEFYNLGMPTT